MGEGVTFGLIVDFFCPNDTFTGEVNGAAGTLRLTGDGFCPCVLLASEVF